MSRISTANEKDITPQGCVEASLPHLSRYDEVLLFVRRNPAQVAWFLIAEA